MMSYTVMDRNTTVAHARAIKRRTGQQQSILVMDPCSIISNACKATPSAISVHPGYAAYSHVLVRQFDHFSRHEPPPISAVTAFETGTNRWDGCLTGRSQHGPDDPSRFIFNLAETRIYCGGAPNPIRRIFRSGKPVLSCGDQSSRGDGGEHDWPNCGAISAKHRVAPTC